MPAVDDWILARADEVAASLATDPYVRSARLLGYSLRSQVRGFFHDPRHPAARRLLELHFDLGFEAGTREAPPLATAIERRWSADGHAVLAGAWRALVRAYEHQLDAAARAAATAPDAAPDDAARVTARRAAFDRWLDGIAGEDQST